MKYNILFCFILLCAPSLSAQLLFGPQNIIAGQEFNLDGPREILSIDIDMDGDQDLVIASFTGRELAWYENLDGQSNFSPKKVIAQSENRPTSIATMDVDRDGDTDILATYSNDDKLVWYENLDSQGTFGEEQLIDNFNNTSNIKVHDIDQDGYLDIMVSSEQLFWYKNIDDEEPFVKQSIIEDNIIAIIDYFALLDYDEDGDIDLVSSHVEGVIYWYENLDGAGNFGTAQILLEIPGADISPFSLNDMDNDGDLDIVMALGIPKLVWYENLDGSGMFSEQLVISEELGSAEFEILDLDNDGALDILFYQLSALTWFKNTNTTNQFEQEFVIDYNADAWNLSATDFNNDGTIDIAIIDKDVDQLAYYEGKLENGVLSFEKNIVTPYVFAPITTVAADFDNDSDNDILVVGDRLVLFENVDNNFGKGRLIQELELSIIYSMEAVDVDNDGDLDILWASFNGNEVAWSENEDGLGTFSTDKHIIESDVNFAKYVISADIDGDNDIDVISGSIFDDKIVWYENLDGLGNFGPQRFITTDLNGISAITTGDLDGDGDLDLLSSSTFDSDLKWYENTNGLGDFGPAQIFNTQNGGGSIHAVDLNNNGDLDVLFGDGNKIGWQENTDGFGMFGTPQIISDVANGVEQTQVTDFDQDGDLDITAALKDNNTIVVYENVNGSGTFGEQMIISEQVDEPVFVFVADLDNDLDEDIISLSKEDNKVAWYANLLNDPTVSGLCYYDVNKNKIKDADEIGLLNQSVTLAPESLASFTNANGRYYFSVTNGDYAITVQPTSDWTLSTDSSTYHLSINDTILPNINFGLTPIEEISIVDPSLAFAPTRCGFEVPFWIDYENTGTTFATGQIHLEIGDLTTLVSAEPYPDEISNTTLIWNFNDLAPTYAQKIRLRLQMPGVDFLGNIIDFEAISYVEDNQGILNKNTSKVYPSTINCAYDPNDKQVYPPGIEEENLTLFGEELEYMIRFQNTGTDTAFTVRLEDQLDPNLNWNSFRPIAASHSYNVTLNQETGVLDFLFENILLPDSTTNEVASHGYVKYRIQTLENLQEATEIKNTASIFFDFNPPIVTNTTLNTMVSELPTSTEDLTELDIQVFPNPFTTHTVFRIGTLPDNEMILNIVNVHKQVLQTYSIHSNTDLRIDGAPFLTGIYFYEIINKEGIHLSNGKIIKQ